MPRTQVFLNGSRLVYNFKMIWTFFMSYTQGSGSVRERGKEKMSFQNAL